jgi:hypothetical protein
MKPPIMTAGAYRSMPRVDFSEHVNARAITAHKRKGPPAGGPFIDCC